MARIRPKKENIPPGVYIGTSGWTYKDWGEIFYPPGEKALLPYLASHFNTVEVNSSFYRLPQVSSFEKWYRETPSDFRFAVKLSQYITHRKRLKGVKREIGTFYDRMLALEEKLGALLVQLPPNLAFDKPIVQKFFTDLRAVEEKRKASVRVAIEPRHKSWFEGETVPVVRELCKRFNVALVFAESSKYPCYEPDDRDITAGFIYLRFHGPDEFAASPYGKRRLRPWAEHITRWREQDLPVFVYFNNDTYGHAVRDAVALVGISKLGN